MKKLFKFSSSYGRMGEVESLFIAEQEEVDKIIGREVYFGEILGKHSEVVLDIEESDFEIKSEDQKFIEQLLFVFEGSHTLSGHNPIEYYENYCEDENEIEYEYDEEDDLKG